MEREQDEKQFSNPMGGAALQIHVNYGAEKNCVRDISANGLISIDLKNQQADNTSMNTLLVDYLSKVLNVSRKQIEIIAGDSENKKLICLLDIPVEVVNKRLSRYT